MGKVVTIFKKLTGLFNIVSWLKRLVKPKTKPLKFLKRHTISVRARLKAFDALLKGGTVAKSGESELQLPLIVLPLIAVPFIVAKAVSAGFMEGGYVAPAGIASKKHFKYQVESPQPGKPTVFINSRIVIPTAYTRYSAPFGYRIHPITGRTTFHAGVDLATKKGKPVNVAMDGKVMFVGNSGDGYGNRVEVEHAGGLLTLYAHLSSIDVTAGQYVRAGQKIGEVGSTGQATGPHLHFEVRYKNQPINPEILYDFNKRSVINTGISVVGDNDILSKDVTTSSTQRYYSFGTNSNR